MVTRNYLDKVLCAQMVPRNDIEELLGAWKATREVGGKV